MSRVADVPAALLRPAGGGRSIAVGWATVDLERAALALGRETAEAPSDDALGARCRIVSVGLPTAAARPAIVLLEPSTEGRLAAFLARSGEGWIAAWYDVPSRRGMRLGPRTAGPFGFERRWLDAPSDGFERFLVEAAPGTMPA